MTIRIEYKTFVDLPKSLHELALTDQFAGEYVRRVRSDKQCAMMIHDDQVVGFFLPQQPRPNGYGRMGIIYVDPKFRKQGFGAEAVRRHLGSRKAKACIADENLASQALFSAAGFQKTGRTERDHKKRTSHWWIRSIKADDEMDFVMVLDHSQVKQAESCIDSIHAFTTSAMVYVLCLDEDTMYWAFRREHVIPTKLKELESAYPQLADAKKHLGKTAYVEACKAFFTSFVFSHCGEDILTHVDPRMVFLSSPLQIEELFGDYSIMVPVHVKSHGEFNSRLYTCRHDGCGHTFLDWWQNKILNGFDSSTKHFEEFYYKLGQLSNVQISEHPGINLTPWNISSHVLTKSDDVLIDRKHKLICYYCHPKNERELMILSNDSMELIYKPYDKSLGGT